MLSIVMTIITYGMITCVILAVLVLIICAIGRKYGGKAWQ